MPENKTPDAAETKPEKKAPPRNVVWKGRGSPPFAVAISMDPVLNLPDEETQRAGFRVKEPGKLIGLYEGYREFREDKGKKGA